MKAHHPYLLIPLLTTLALPQAASAAEGRSASYQLARAGMAIVKRQAKRLVIDTSAKQKAPPALLKLQRKVVRDASGLVDAVRGAPLPFSEVKAEVRDENGHAMLSTPAGVFSASTRGMALRVDRDAQGRALDVPHAVQLRLDSSRGSAFYKRESYPSQRIVLDETISFETVMPVEGQRHPLATREIGKIIGEPPVVGTTLVRSSKRGDTAETFEIWHPNAEGQHQRIAVDPAKHELLTSLWNYINETLDPPAR